MRRILNNEKSSTRAPCVHQGVKDEGFDGVAISVRSSGVGEWMHSADHEHDAQTYENIETRRADPEKKTADESKEPRTSCEVTRRHERRRESPTTQNQCEDSKNRRKTPRMLSRENAEDEVIAAL